MSSQLKAYIAAYPFPAFLLQAKPGHGLYGSSLAPTYTNASFRRLFAGSSWSTNATSSSEDSTVDNSSQSDILASWINALGNADTAKRFSYWIADIDPTAPVAALSSDDEYRLPAIPPSPNEPIEGTYWHQTPLEISLRAASSTPTAIKFVTLLFAKTLCEEEDSWAITTVPLTSIRREPSLDRTPSESETVGSPNPTSSSDHVQHSPRTNLEPVSTIAAGPKPSFHTAKVGVEPVAASPPFPSSIPTSITSLPSTIASAITTALAAPLSSRRPAAANANLRINDLPRPNSVVHPQSTGTGSNSRKGARDVYSPLATPTPHDIAIGVKDNAGMGSNIVPLRDSKDESIRDQLPNPNDVFPDRVLEQASKSESEVDPERDALVNVPSASSSSSVATITALRTPPTRSATSKSPPARPSLQHAPLSSSTSTIFSDVDPAVPNASPLNDQTPSPSFIPADNKGFEMRLKEDDDVRRLLDEIDWSKTGLGPRSKWPISLKTCCTCTHSPFHVSFLTDDLFSSEVALVLENPYPSAIWWGPELIIFYNGAYAAMAGNKHPNLFGKAGAVAWSEIWDA